MGNGGKQTRKRVRGRKQQELSPSLPNPAASPFFLAHFSFLFPNYLKACYRLNTSFISNFLWYMFNLSVKHFWPFVFNCFQTAKLSFFSFLFSFFYFFFVSFYRIFQTYFSLGSRQSHSLSSPPPPPICSRQEGTTILFFSRPLVQLFCVLGLRKEYGLLCGLKDFSLIDGLGSWKLQL